MKNPLVAPAGVLVSEADDQVLDVAVQLRPAGVAVGVGPGAGDEAPVPAQQRVRLHKEARPADSGQHPADRGEHGPVSGFELGSGNLATQHGELMAQDEDLKILGSITASEQREQLDGAAQREVGEFGQHQGWPPRG